MIPIVSLHRRSRSIQVLAVGSLPICSFPSSCSRDSFLCVQTISPTLPPHVHEVLHTMSLSGTDLWPLLPFRHVQYCVITPASTVSPHCLIARVAGIEEPCVMSLRRPSTVLVALTYLYRGFFSIPVARARRTEWKQRPQVGARQGQCMGHLVHLRRACDCSREPLKF